ncbi:hypothetical protein [Parageobacillus thermantarcticus]|nr:hypothetical protein [Parageobacillus thermantarcticus]
MKKWCGARAKRGTTLRSADRSTKQYEKTALFLFSRNFTKFVDFYICFS